MFIIGWSIGIVKFSVATLREREKEREREREREKENVNERERGRLAHVHPSKSYMLYTGVYIVYIMLMICNHVTRIHSPKGHSALSFTN